MLINLEEFRAHDEYTLDSIMKPINKMKYK